jgi:hypothetical protein
MTMTWQGWDGSLWNLCGGDGPSGVALAPGLRGLDEPPFQIYESESDARAGTRFRGARAQKREIFWNASVFSDTSSQGWLDYDRAFHKTLHPEKPGLFTVQQPSGEYRTVSMRFVSSDKSWDYSPGLRGWAQYGLTFQAEDPFWKGAPIVRSWGASDPVEFIDHTTGAPPFNISSSSTFDTASMPNPGDVPAWPVWTVTATGTVTSVTVGVNGRLVTYAGSLTSGQSLTLDSRAMTAKVGSTNVTASLTVRDWAPIPEGSEVPLTVSMTGTGTVQAVLTPNYFRAY